MESNNRKFTVLSLLGLSGLSAYVFYLIATQIADMLHFGGSNVLAGLSWTVVGGTVSALFGFVLFLVLILNSKVTAFSDDVFAELQKTTWPKSKETFSSTLAVSIMVGVASVILFFLDQIWGWLFSRVL